MLRYNLNQGIAHLFNTHENLGSTSNTAKRKKMLQIIHNFYFLHNCVISKMTLLGGGKQEDRRKRGKKGRQERGKNEGRKEQRKGGRKEGMKRDKKTI